MAQSIKDAGVWKPVGAGYVKDAGVWKPIAAAYVKDAGVWKPFGYKQITNLHTMVIGCGNAPLINLGTFTPTTFGARSVPENPDRWLILFVAGSGTLGITVNGASVSLTNGWGAVRVPSGSITVSATSSGGGGGTTMMAGCWGCIINSTPTLISNGAGSGTRPAGGFVLGAHMTQGNYVAGGISGTPAPVLDELIQTSNQFNNAYAGIFSLGVDPDSSADSYSITAPGSVYSGAWS